MARRTTKRSTATEAKATQGLIDALKFVSVAQKDKGAPNETHCIMLGRFVAAFDGVLAAGHAISEDIAACPQTAGMIHALERCGSVYSVTQFDTGIAIKSEKFRAVIPCVDRGILNIPTLDNPCADITDALKEGFKTIVDLAADKADTVAQASILLRSQTMMATNGKILIEYWHGIDLPPNMIIPKAAAIAILKTNKPLAKLGYSGGSVTFYFADNSWLRTQCYAEGWPIEAYDKGLTANTHQEPIPEGLFIAIDAIAKFSEDGKVYLWEKGLVSSSPHPEIGATYETVGIRHNCAVLYDSLKFIQPLAKTIDFNGPNGNVYFIGERTRGVMVSYVL